MGNCFSSDKSNFQGEGRTLGSNPTNTVPPPRSNNARASVPASAKISGPTAGSGQTLGGNPQAPNESQSPKEAAARAAEERAKAATKNKGKLGRQLDAQRGQTQAETLAQNARDNVAARDADEAAQARNYN